jgi:hypothetical protein
MAKDGAKDYTKEEDNIIVKLFDTIGDEGLSKMLGRRIGGIYSRRLKLGLHTKRNKVLPDEQTIQVEQMLLRSVPIPKIVELFEKATVYVVYRIRDEMFDRMSKQKKQYVEPIKSFFCLGQTTAYWKDEQEIAFYMDQNYYAKDLKGWEFEQLMTTIKSEHKLQAL